MSPAAAADFLREAMLLTLLVAAPLLVTALLVGVVVSLLQAITQVQEQTVAFVAKLVALSAVMLLVLPWGLDQLVGYLVRMLRSLPAMAM
jgi:flagellar biosynthetic protein FliQ